MVFRRGRAAFGDGFGRKEYPLADAHLPFFELTYHGILLYNPTSPTVNYPIKNPEDKLTFILRGGRPSFYFHSKFRTGAKNWMGEIDFLTDTDEDLDFACDRIAEAQREYEALSHLQKVYMSDYVTADGIEIAAYENGTEIVGNFSEEEKTYRGVSIAPGEYKIIN